MPKLPRCKSSDSRLMIIATLLALCLCLPPDIHCHPVTSLIKKVVKPSDREPLAMALGMYLLPKLMYHGVEKKLKMKILKNFIKQKKYGQVVPVSVVAPALYLAALANEAKSEYYLVDADEVHQPPPPPPPTQGVYAKPHMYYKNDVYRQDLDY